MSPRRKEAEHGCIRYQLDFKVREIMCAKRGRGQDKRKRVWAWDTRRREQEIRRVKRVTHMAVYQVAAVEGAATGVGLERVPAVYCTLHLISSKSVHLRRLTPSVAKN